MPWVPFTVDHVKSRIFDVEDETIEAAGNSQDKLTAIVDQLIAKIRGLIISNPNVAAIGPNGTIPDFVLSDAAVIARAAILGMPPVQEGYTDPRKSEYDKAVKFIETLPTMNAKVFATDDASDISATSTTAGNGAYGGSPLQEF